MKCYIVFDREIQNSSQFAFAVVVEVEGRERERQTVE